MNKKKIYETISSWYEPDNPIKIPVNQLGLYFLGRGIAWAGFWVFLGLVLL